MLLRRLGYLPTYESTPFGALERLENETFDLVVSDFDAGPGPNGVEVLRAAKQFQPNAKRVLMSGHLLDEIGDIEGAAFLSKPFDQQKLAATISA